MSADNGTVLRLEAVSKFFPGVKALDRVDLAVQRGEIHGLVGENGAGKSTLMGIASAALRADEGRAIVMGQVIGADPEQVRELGLAIVRQEPMLMPDLTVAENIYLSLPACVRPEVAYKDQFAAEALLRWGPDTGILPGDRVETLNPEKRFIVEIVKAMAGEINILVLDEPTEHLGADDVQRLFERIRALANAGCAIIYISHRLKEVQAISERLTVLRDGKSIGTFEARGLSEDDIIALIVGAKLTNEFPEKNLDFERSATILAVADYSGPGFSNVTFDLQEGEILGLAGIDANGQRELLRNLAGLNPGAEKIKSHGKAHAITSVRRSITAGFNFLTGDRHREGIAADLSVRENYSIRSLSSMSFGPLLDRNAEGAKALEAVRNFAVKTPSLETEIAALSGGNQQKLILASVLAAQPKILLIDEPTQGVDIGARAEIYQTLRSIAATGVAIIVVSSDAHELAGLCDRVMIFSRGMIVERLAGDDVTDSRITAAALKSTATRQHERAARAGFMHWASGHYAPSIMVALAVLVMGAIATFINPSYLSPRGLGGMMLLVAALAFVAYGQQLLMLIGGIDLSVGPLMGLVGVVGSFFFHKEAGATLHVIGWGAIFLTAVAVGTLNFALVDFIRLHPLIATLASYMGLQAVSLLLRPVPGGMFNYDLLDVIGYRLGFVPVSFLLAIAAALFLDRLLYRRRMGIALRGFGSAPEAARLMGIRPMRMRLYAYIGCALLAALSGIVMMAQVGIGDARAGTSYTLTSIAAALIGGASLFGGRGSFIGAILGALLIVQVNQVTAFIRLDSAWSSFLLGGMILAAVTLYSMGRKRALAQ